MTKKKSDSSGDGMMMMMMIGFRVKTAFQFRRHGTLRQTWDVLTKKKIGRDHLAEMIRIKNHDISLISPSDRVRPIFEEFK